MSEMASADPRPDVLLAETESGPAESGDVEREPMTKTQARRLARLAAREITTVDHTDPEQNPELRTAIAWAGRRPGVSRGWRDR